MACLSIMNQRSIIEQASAAIDGTEYLDLTILDIGTPRWTEQLYKTYNPCFNVSIYPPFTQPIRKMQYNTNIYYLSTNPCPEDCNNQGLCTLGRCTCLLGWHSLSCNMRNCYNSLVFVDIDIIDPQQCYHCSQNGICDNGTCTCQDPYITEDCSTRSCLNNCSNTPQKQVADCIPNFP